MVNADILLGYRTDHSLPKQRGPGFWKLNTHLLSEEYKDQNNVDAVLLWDGVVSSSAVYSEASLILSSFCEGRAQQITASGVIPMEKVREPNL